MSPSASPCRLWQLRTKCLTFDELPAIMGIVNVTPDSFSDGGRFFEANRAIEHGLQLADEGAAILDIGGESTRPHADEITVQEELRRVVEVVQQLAEQTTVPVSIDTSKASVAREALAAGAEIINDVTGLEGDADMLEVALASRAGLCVMHMRGNPRTMQAESHLQYEDVVQDVVHYLRQRRDFLLQAGIEKQRLCLDPGIGFAKTSEQNWQLLQNMRVFHELEVPLLVGHSRKGFLGKILNSPDRDRTSATVGVSLALAAKGVQVLRVHDVQAVRDALITFTAAGGRT